MGLEQIMRTECDKRTHFFAWTSCSARFLKDEFDCCSQVVVANEMGNSSEVFKCFDMSPEEAFLPLRGKQHHKGSTGEAEPHHEDLDLLTHASNDCVGFSPIDLGILPWIKVKRQEHIRSARRLFVPSNIVANR